MLDTGARVLAKRIWPPQEWQPATVQAVTIKNRLVRVRWDNGDWGQVEQSCIRPMESKEPI